MCKYIHTLFHHFFMLKWGQIPHSALCESQVHSAPEPTPPTGLWWLTSLSYVNLSEYTTAETLSLLFSQSFQASSLLAPPLIQLTREEPEHLQVAWEHQSGLRTRGNPTPSDTSRPLRNTTISKIPSLTLF